MDRRVLLIIWQLEEEGESDSRSLHTSTVWHCGVNILEASVEYTELTSVKLPVVLQTIELSDVAYAHCKFSIKHYDTTNNIFIHKNKMHPVFNNNNSLKLYRVN